MCVYYGKGNTKNVNKKDSKIRHLHSIPNTKQHEIPKTDTELTIIRYDYSSIMDMGYTIYKILLQKITRLMGVFLCD